MILVLASSLPCQMPWNLLLIISAAALTVSGGGLGIICEAVDGVVPGAVVGVTYGDVAGI